MDRSIEANVPYKRFLEYYSRNPITKSLYNNFFSKGREVVRLLDKNDKLLEVGCGTGESSLRILEMLKGQSFEASEVEETFVEKMRQNNFPFVVSQESVYRLKRQDGEFDCIFLLEVLEHLHDYDLALKEVFRVSRKFVVISIPNEPLFRALNVLRGRYLKYLGNTPGHVQHWSVKGIKKTIEKYGTVRKVYTPVPWILLLAEVPDK